MDSVIIANILQFIPTLGGFWANSIINRRKQTIIFAIFLYNTSKASFFDNDKIPVFNAKKEESEETSKHQFSGKRIKRGLYQTKDGFLINANVNGSLNILRKSKAACNTLERIKSASRGLVANPVKIVIF